MTSIHIMLVALILLSCIHIVNPEDEDQDPVLQQLHEDGAGDTIIAEDDDNDADNDADTDETNAKSALFQAQIFHPPNTVEQIGKRFNAELWASEFDETCQRQIRVMSTLTLDAIWDICEKSFNDWLLVHPQGKRLCPDLHLHLEKVAKKHVTQYGPTKEDEYEEEEEDSNPEILQHELVFVAQPEPSPSSQTMEEIEKVKKILNAILKEKSIPWYDMMAYQASEKDKETQEDIRKKIGRVIRHKVPVNVASIKQGAASRGYVGHEYYNMGDRDNEFEARYPQVLCHIVEQGTGNEYLRPVWQSPRKDQKARTEPQLKGYLERVCGTMDLRRAEFRISPEYAASILPQSLLITADK